MKDDLFRPEAVENARRRLDGAILVATPLSLKVLVIASVVVVAALAGFGLLASYSRSVTGQGWVTAGDGIVYIRSPTTGQVAEVAVDEGAAVEPGTSLVRLALADTDHDGIRSSQNLERRIQIAEQRNQAESDRFARESQALAAELASTHSRVGVLQSRVELQRQRLEAASAALARVEPIAAQGYLPARELEARRSAVLDQRAALLIIEGEHSEARNQVDLLSARTAALRSAALVANYDGELAGSELSGALAQRQEAAERIIGASQQGRIVAIYVRSGQSVVPGDRLVALGQGDGPLRVEIFISRADVQHVKAGQSALIWANAEARRRGRAVNGIVRSVSRLPLSQNELEVPGLQGSTELYKISVDIRPGQDIDVLSVGQSVFADIRVKTRPFWALFAPTGA